MTMTEFHTTPDNLEESTVAQIPTSRLFMLGAMSILLCMSYFLTLFSPLPIAIAAFLFGRVKGYVLGVASWMVVSLISLYVLKDMSFAYFYVIALFFAVMISEVSLRSVSPYKGILFNGMIMIALTAGLLGMIKLQNDRPFREILIEELKSTTDQFKKNRGELAPETSKETVNALALFSQPELLADELMKSFPGYFIMTVFFTLWANLFVLLRVRRVMNPFSQLSYTDKSMLELKLPDWCIYPVIVALILSVWGDYVFGPLGNTYGLTLLKAIGVFYFFQGFGIVSQFLTHWKIFGIFRILMVMFVIFTGAWLVAIIGLADVWINFNRFTKKQNP
jgi:hypothetical protein